MYKIPNNVKKNISVGYLYAVVQTRDMYIFLHMADSAMGNELHKKTLYKKVYFISR